MQVHEGEALLLPLGGYHKAYNFGQGILNVLYIIAPKIWLDLDAPMDFEGQNMKMYKGPNNAKLPGYPEISQWYQHGTTDDIGRWPVPGPECRKSLSFFIILMKKRS